MTQPAVQAAEVRAATLAEGHPFGYTDFASTDSGNAELLAHLLRDEVRFYHRNGKWYLWDRHWWQADASAEIVHLAKCVARARRTKYDRELFPDERQANREWRFAVSAENKTKLEAMLKLAQSENPIAVGADEEWDDDPWLLGVANGVVNLRTGALVRGEREQRITRHVPVRYEPDAPAPAWGDFLQQVFGNDLDLVGFVLRAIGYSLTGCTREQKLFFLSGEGSNGKSTFLAVLRALAGPYATNTGFRTFERHDRASIPNELAALNGARVVTAAETSDAARLNEARIKAVTGGDPITARFLYGEDFTFVPAFKLWLSSNHNPVVKDDSHGFWRRVLRIPFDVQFGCFDDGRCTDDCAVHPPADDQLEDKLLAELPGILALAVKACGWWLEQGLNPPERVRLATADYRAEQDPLLDFVQACCQDAPDDYVRSHEAHRAYQRWAESEGLTQREILGSKTFSKRFAAHYPRKRTAQGSVFLGVQISLNGYSTTDDGMPDDTM